ncbi:MAG: putative nucleic acid-binding protein [Limisphaerales bacterium]
MAEFIHIVSDARRMPNPLSVSDATSRAEVWWNAGEVVRVFPEGQTVPSFFAWLRQHRLGRKRLLDTLLAATFREAGIAKIITNNGKDYAVFGCFDIVEYH